MNKVDHYLLIYIYLCFRPNVGCGDWSRAWNVGGIAASLLRPLPPSIVSDMAMWGVVLGDQCCGVTRHLCIHSVIHSFIYSINQSINQSIINQSLFLEHRTTEQQNNQKWTAERQDSKSTDKLECTHGVRTHAVRCMLTLTPTLTLTLNFDLSTPNHVTLGIPWSFPISSLNTLGSFVFELCSDYLCEKCTYWPCDLDLWPFSSKSMSLTSSMSQGHSLYHVWTLWNHSLSIMLRTNRQKQTDSKILYPRQPTKSTWVIILRLYSVGSIQNYRTDCTDDTE